MAGELRRQGVGFRKDDNAFLSTSDPQALQAAADRLSPRDHPQASGVLDPGVAAEVLQKRTGQPSTCTETIP